MPYLPSLNEQQLRQLISVLILAGVGLPAILILSRLLRRALAKRTSEHAAMLAGRFLYYGGVAIILLCVLWEFGISLSPLLGAAGVVGIAVGFAAQTSLSNLICGIFLIVERPFAVGDLVKMDSYTGVVHSIDLLSVKLRTLDNTLIRIANETLIKTPFTNVTAFPIRRMDISIGVAYKEDIPRVMEVLREVADATPQCLDEPEPLILFKGFGESSLDFTLGLWFAKPDYVALRNAVLPAIKKRFDELGIEIPFPHRTLYVGAATEPFPVRVVQS